MISKKFLCFLYSIIAILGYNSAYSIQADEQSILLRLGKYNGTVPPGLHFKIPVVDNVYKVKTSKQFVEEFGLELLNQVQELDFQILMKMNLGHLLMI